MANDHVFRQVLNGGHRRGGNIVRFMHGYPRWSKTFAALAIASIGTLPLPIVHRSIVINMARADHPLERFDALDTAALDEIHERIYVWARNVTLDTDPAMPGKIVNRAADNWRPLLAIADACGTEWGERARQAASIMTSDYQDEDLGVTLLTDIRKVFETLDTDRVPSADLVGGLLLMDEAPWSEWRGPRGDQQPRRLSLSGLAGMLSSFQNPLALDPGREARPTRPARATSAPTSRRRGIPTVVTAQRHNLRRGRNASA